MGHDHDRTPSANAGSAAATSVERATNSPSRWHVGAVVGVLTLAVVFAGPGRAAQAVDGFGDPPDGEWYATMWAELTHTDTYDGARVDYAGVVDGLGEFTFRGGVADGLFVMDIISVIMMDHPEGNGVIDQFWEGDGTIAGDGWLLTMDGAAEGHAVTTMNIAGVGSVTQSQDGFTSPIGPFDVPIVEVRCDTIVADWAPTLELEAAEQGMVGVNVVGEMTATYVAAPDDQAPFFDRFEELKAEIQRWAGEIIDGATLDMDRFLDLSGQLMDLEVERRRNIESCLFGSDEDRDEFVNFAGLAMESLVLTLLHHVEVDPSTIDLLLDVLLEFGMLGAGSSSTSGDLLEHLVTVQLERYLADNLQSDGTSSAGESCSAAAPCLPDDHQALRLFRTADRLGLKLSAGGTSLDAGAIGDAILRSMEDDA